VSAPDPTSAVFHARVAWLLQAAADAFDALQAPDPDLDAERAVMAGEPISAPVQRRAA
jgi:hypothetical protein